jgi:hypothetical protein
MAYSVLGYGNAFAMDAPLPEKPASTFKTVKRITDVSFPKGTVVFLDIDDTIVRPGHQKNQSQRHGTFRALDPRLAKKLRNAKEAGEIQYYFLTARKMDDERVSITQLTRPGFCTENQLQEMYIDQGAGGRNKGNDLYDKLYNLLSPENSSYPFPERIFAFDDLEEKLFEIQKAQEEQKASEDPLRQRLGAIPLCLYRKENDFKLYESLNLGQHVFPENLKDFSLVGRLKPNAKKKENNPFLIKNNETEETYVFKTDPEPDKTITKILKKEINYALKKKGSSPLAVYGAIPNIDELQATYNSVRGDIRSPGPHLLIPHKGDYQKETVEHKKQHFTSHLLLDDLLNDKHAYFAGKKGTNTLPWDNYSNITLETIRAKALELDGNWENVDADVRAQAQDLINQWKTILGTFDTVSQALQIEHSSELKKILRLRLDHLVQVFNLDCTMPGYLTLPKERQFLEENFKPSNEDPTFEKFYKKTTGIKLKEEKRFFAKYVSEANLPMMELLFEQHPQLNLNVTFIPPQYEKKWTYEGCGILDSLPLQSEQSLEILSFLQLHGLKEDAKNWYGKGRSLLELIDAATPKAPEPAVTPKVQEELGELPSAAVLAEAFDEAIKSKESNLEKLNSLLSRYDMKCMYITRLRDSQGEPLILVASDNNHMEVVKALLSLKDIDWNDSKTYLTNAEQLDVTDWLNPETKALLEEARNRGK